MHAHLQVSGILMLFSLLTMGQNYQTVYPNQENCFLTKNGNITCLRIDSLSEESNTVLLHPSRANLSIGDNCFSPFAGSWIGKEIEIRNNGENVFINHADEQVIINTHAGLGYEWVAYEVAGEMEIRATVIAHNTMNFLGLTDSVKTIAFQAYEAGGQPLDFEVNTMQVKISKHHGWIQPLNFNYFPDFYFYYYMLEENLQELSIAGLSEPQKGIKNFTWLDVYDFQPGDVLHVFREDGDWEGMEDGFFNITETRSIFKYLERTDYEDSIQYTYSRVQRIEKQWLDSIAIYTDTLTKVITPNPSFDNLPFEPAFDLPLKDKTEAYMYYRMWKNDDEHLVKSNSNYWFEKHMEGCWFPVHFDGIPNSEYYMKGLGGPYHPFSDMFGHSLIQKLVYYEKDGTTWGSPLDVTSVESIAQPDLVKIYPNPARESFTVDIDPYLSGDFSIRLMDVKGRSVLEQKVSSGNTTVNVTQLTPGIYFCIVTGRQGIVYTHKLLIR